MAFLLLCFCNWGLITIVLHLFLIPQAMPLTVCLYVVHIQKKRTIRRKQHTFIQDIVGEKKKKTVYIWKHCNIINRKNNSIIWEIYLWHFFSIPRFFFLLCCCCCSFVTLLLLFCDPFYLRFSYFNV